MSVYIIAECGQNHNGDLDMARALIDMAAMPIYHEGQRLEGVNAVKFTKRDLSAELSVDMENAPYEGRHSFGRTYGDHRRALEMSDKALGVLCDYAHALGLEFVLTVCNPGALSCLSYAKADRLKIASRDARNVPLLRVVNRAGRPVIVSTGFCGPDVRYTLDHLLDVSELWILYCVSEYPASYRNLSFAHMEDIATTTGLRTGYSDHTTGTQAAPWAVMRGATVVEKHVTLDHGLPGTDHAGSMDHEGLRRVVRDIRNAELVLADKPHHLTRSVFTKLSRSVCAARDIKAGETIHDGDLHMLSAGGGLSWDEAPIGRIAAADIMRNKPIREEDVR